MEKDASHMATDACRIGAKQLMHAAMALTLDQLPDDLDALKRLVVAKDTALEAKDAELVVAKNGLIESTLTVEHLKFQLAKLRR